MILGRAKFLATLLVIGAAIFILEAYSNSRTKFPRTCTELFAVGDSRPPQMKGVDRIACLWHKRTLRVRFLEGDPAVQQKVEYYAKQWTAYSGITFDFDSGGTADIRVAFNPQSGSWSYVGECQTGVGLNAATMNYGWLTPTTEDAEYQRVVLHEFGHALGLLHEHQNPAGGIPWNEEAVYSYYHETQGWDQQETYNNVIRKYGEEETNHTKYDPDSIMEYPIPAELTLNGFHVGWNRNLSETDKQFIRSQYGE